MASPVQLTPNGIVLRVVRRLETQVDRLIHSAARHAARRRLSSRSAPRRIVVVCYGNICRSPYAAAALRRRLAAGVLNGVEVDSVGFIGPGRPANDQAMACAERRGVDLTSHRSRLFAPGDADADLIVVMTRDHRVALQRSGLGGRVELLGDFDTADPPAREIADPYGADDEEFRRVFDQIDRSVEGLVHELTVGARAAEHEGGRPR